MRSNKSIEAKVRHLSEKGPLESPPPPVMSRKALLTLRGIYNQTDHEVHRLATRDNFSKASGGGSPLPARRADVANVGSHADGKLSARQVL